MSEKEKRREIPVEDISRILDTVSDKVPRLIKELMASFYSEDNGRQMGKAVASMYRELIDAGMPEDEAIKMAKDYLNALQNFMPKEIHGSN